jgi:hypothetical protein
MDTTTEFRNVSRDQTVLRKMCWWTMQRNLWPGVNTQFKGCIHSITITLYVFITYILTWRYKPKWTSAQCICKWKRLVIHKYLKCWFYPVPSLPRSKLFSWVDNSTCSNIDLIKIYLSFISFTPSPNASFIEPLMSVWKSLQKTLFSSCCRG